MTSCYCVCRDEPECVAWIRSQCQPPRCRSAALTDQGSDRARPRQTPCAAYCVNPPALCLMSLRPASHARRAEGHEGQADRQTDGRTDSDGSHCVTICMAGLRSDSYRLPKGRALASRLVNKSQWRSGGSNRLVKRGTDQYEALQPLAVRLPHGLRTQIFGHNEYLCVFVELVALFLSSCCAAASSSLFA